MDNSCVRIIASRGTLDWGFQTFIYAATAHALGFEVDVFFTSNGVHLLRKDIPRKVTLFGHPGMPIPLINNRRFPNILCSLPGAQALITRMVERTMKKNGIPSVEECRSLCLSAGITFIASQTSLTLAKINLDDLIPEVTEFCNEAPIIANQNCLFLQF
jgi:peroxiredoxin family protein